MATKSEPMTGGGHRVSVDHGERKSKKKKLRRLSVQRAKNGGHTVEHEYHSNGNGFEAPTQHVFGKSDGASLMQHLRRHLLINDGPAVVDEASDDAAEEE